ncbi:RNA polymerase sigma factor [Rhizosaccharibacter radicis]|uniref:Sigma-70 family RNA polymerase sigma factor n=1 Tax=Rhizosaccharibacter radicis TaxID=2782605 RepID=A0ABT1W137_9PROT|nr:sigma-70 family RNA polymerase sigma factor [Acetobacteraceae bacterium KSS12]
MDEQDRQDEPPPEATPPQSEAPRSPLDGLLRRCADGDKEAFRQLYDSQAPRLYGLALRLMRQPALAADAVHDAFLQAWQRADRFDPSRGSAETWLASLLRYRAIDIRRRRSREEPGLEPRDEPDTDPDALAQLTAASELQALRQCMDALSDGQRRVITMAFMDGLSHSELAGRLGSPLGTVKSWVRRALLSLRRCLDGLEA